MRKGKGGMEGLIGGREGLCGEGGRKGGERDDR